MNTLINNIAGTINTTPITTFDTMYSSHIDIDTCSSLEDNIAKEELSETNFCPLPPYCLLEEKQKYLAG